MVFPPLISILRQSFFLPKAELTERNIGSLSGKVVIVTGGNSGVGLELAGIVYGAGATTFLAGRNESACAEAIQWIKKGNPSSTGSIEWLKLDLSDLDSVATAAREFLSKADRLDYLANNAGVMAPPAQSKGKQGHELQHVTNCLGPYLFTELLRPILVKTAKEEKAKGRENVVRVSWAGSIGIDINKVQGGVEFDKGASGLDEPHIMDDPMANYMVTKTGNLFLCKIWGDEVKNDGVVSVCFNPGNLSSGLQRHSRAHVSDWFFTYVLEKLLHHRRYGAYTELYCGFSPDITTADQGQYIAPWGRKFPNRPDIEESKHGEIGIRYVEWAKREVKPYLSTAAQNEAATTMAAPPPQAASGGSGLFA